MQSPCPSILLYKLRNQTSDSTEGVKLRADTNLGVTQSQLLALYVVFLYDTLWSYKHSWQVDHTASSREACLELGMSAWPTSGCPPIHRPTASPAEATPWELLFHFSPYLESKQRFPEAQRLSLLPIVPASNASSPWTIRT